MVWTHNADDRRGRVRKRYTQKQRENGQVAKWEEIQKIGSRRVEIFL